MNAHHKLVCHCLLVETSEGLVLVDTGLGERAAGDPLAVPAGFRLAARPRFDVEEAAARHVERLGFQRKDVRDIVVTHLDLDHAGGLRDFPDATVHVLGDEHAAATSPSSARERDRYRSVNWSHDVKWALHAIRGERWHGFDCVRDIPGLPPEILLVPLGGHSRGHCGVAIDAGNRWLLHCGDAYFHKDELRTKDPRCPAALIAVQRFDATDDRLRRHNQERLRELSRTLGERIRLFSAHDPDDLLRMQGESTLPTSSTV